MLQQALANTVQLACENELMCIFCTKYPLWSLLIPNYLDEYKFSCILRGIESYLKKDIVLLEVKLKDNGYDSIIYEFT